VTSQTLIPKGSFSLLTGSRLRRSPNSGTGSTPSRRSGMSAECGKKDNVDRSSGFFPNRAR
jgi:hypothetical protein